MSRRKNISKNVFVVAGCECDPQGSVSDICDQQSGQCACQPHVMGQRCDHCQPGFWGFPLCQPCECNHLSEMCDGETGECQNCRDHATGPNCDRLHTETTFRQFLLITFILCVLFYLLISGAKCFGGAFNLKQPINFLLLILQHAHKLVLMTHLCCYCRCENGYYGSPVTRQSCQPCLCPDILSSGRYFATSCQHDTQSLSVKCYCQEGHTGRV